MTFKKYEYHDQYFRFIAVASAQKHGYIGSGSNMENISLLDDLNEFFC